MSEGEPKRHPLGGNYKIAISCEELGMAFKHRAETGEPTQSYVRRLVREGRYNQDGGVTMTESVKEATPKALELLLAELRRPLTPAEIEERRKWGSDVLKHRATMKPFEIDPAELIEAGRED